VTGALVSRAELGAWRRIRRYAVPRAMIEAATAARLAGDWRAACTAAGIAVAASEEALAPFAGDLRHLAPDLLRWHLPRSPGRGDTTIGPRALITLAEHAGAVLAVATPRVGFDTQRLTLLVVTEVDRGRHHVTTDWSAARQLWHAGHAGELVERTCGPRTLEVLALQDAGRTAQAWELAGIEVPPLPGDADNDWWASWLGRHFRTLDADPACVLAAARATGGATASVAMSEYHSLRLHDLHAQRPRAEWVEVNRRRNAKNPDVVSTEPLLRPIDLHLVRLGLVSPAELHPLIGPLLEPFARSAAAPGAAARRSARSAAAPGAAARPEPVRVRCGGQWHQVRWAGGRLAIPHTDDERRREEALRALGGELQGCFAAAQGWRDRAVRLPRRLEGQRRDLMTRAQHGDLAGVLGLLDAGVDPHARDPHGRTLLHLLPCLDWPGADAAGLLDRLLAAGLDLDGRDHRGRTPLHTAVHGDGSPRLVRALLDAGADPDAEDFVGDTIAQAVQRHRQDDLPFLAARRP
jgi:hypothetical protein